MSLQITYLTNCVNKHKIYIGPAIDNMFGSYTTNQLYCKSIKNESRKTNKKIQNHHIWYQMVDIVPYENASK